MASWGVQTIGSPFHVEGGIQQDRDLGNRLELLEQAVVVRVDLFGNDLERGSCHRRGPPPRSPCSAPSAASKVVTTYGARVCRFEVLPGAVFGHRGAERPPELAELHHGVDAVPGESARRGSARIERLPKARGPPSIRPFKPSDQQPPVEQPGDGPLDALRPGIVELARLEDGFNLAVAVAGPQGDVLNLGPVAGACRAWYSTVIAEAMAIPRGPRKQRGWMKQCRRCVRKAAKSAVGASR